MKPSGITKIKRRRKRVGRKESAETRKKMMERKTKKILSS
jgi:hypothetical protein